MPKNSRLCKGLCMVMALCCMVLWGTSCGQEPQKKWSQENIQEEPKISLFINDTGEKKQIMMEEYITGVVAAEMEPSWPIQALAAQAILARTFTMENIVAGRVRDLHGTDASTSVEEFQAYDPSRINDAVRQAVESTRGQVATFQGEYIKAWFSACDGGISASAWEGLAYNKTPTDYLQVGVKDDCLSITTDENRYWQAAIPLEQVRAAVKKVTGTDPGAIQTAVILQKGDSGRAETIQIGQVQVGGPALRLALGGDKVRSMLLDKIFIQGNQMIFVGKGYGHGVGMCQWGAKRLATLGKSPQDIV